MTLLEHDLDPDSAKTARNQKLLRWFAVGAAAALVILSIWAYQKARELDATKVARDGIAKELERLKRDYAGLAAQIAALNADAGATKEERDRIARQESDLEAKVAKLQADSRKLGAEAEQATGLLASVRSLQGQLDQARRERDDAVQTRAAEAKQRQDAEGRAAQLEARVNSLTKEIETVRASVVRPEPSPQENLPVETQQAKATPPPQQPNQTPATGQRAGETRVNFKDGLTYVWIPPGKFMMGCSPGDKECEGDEKPQHEVMITKGFWMGQTPVTQEAYSHLTGTNLSWFRGPRLPAEKVNWNEALAYCTATGMHLPTEAEWEYAARAGSTAARYGDLDEIAWYATNSGRRTHDVGRMKPNAFGLYDMLGNVFQWTDDWSGDKYYERSPASDPAGPATGKRRILRGGSFWGNPMGIRASVRAKDDPATRVSDIGFRCVGDTIN